MYTMCATEKTARQQLVFEQTFLQMLLENDYDDITISDLCRRADLSRKIFYRLFERKADVLYALVDHTILEAANYVSDSSADSGGLHRFFSFWKTKKGLLDMLQKHQNSHMLTDRIIRHIMRENAETVHIFGADETPYKTETLLFYISGIMSLVLIWHASGYDRSIDEMSEMLMELLSSAPIKHHTAEYKNSRSL